MVRGMVKFIATLVLLIPCAPVFCAESAEKIRVLMITGVDHPAHHWTLTAPAVRQILTNDERFEVRIVETPEVLATAQSKVTGKQHPMAFVLEYGKGRVFHTSLGHDARAILGDGTAELIRRGCMWTVNRQP
jgi:type 1 glutamine amidotransferase